MKGISADDIHFPARRGQVIQRVLVEGWTAAEAARAAGFDERSVVRWVADYRRRGLASLREDPSGPRWRQSMTLFLRSLRREVAHWVGAPPAAAPARPMPLRRSREERR